MGGGVFSRIEKNMKNSLLGWQGREDGFHSAHVISQVPGCDIWQKISTRWVAVNLELQRVV